MAKKQHPQTHETHDNTVCDCGRHYGLGVWTPEKRAQVYAWHRDKYRCKYTKKMMEWMADYQRHHGHVKPNI